MSNRIVINGKEVTNPVAKSLIGGCGAILGLVIAAVLLILVMPAVGIAIGISLGAGPLILILVLLALPIIIAIGALAGMISAPFNWIARKLGRTKDEDDGPIEIKPLRRE